MSFRLFAVQRVGAPRGTEVGDSGRGGEAQPREDTTNRRGSQAQGEGAGRKKAGGKDETRGGPHTHRANVTEAIQVHIVMRRYPSSCIIVQSATAARYFRDHACQHKTNLRTQVDTGASSICSATANDIPHGVCVPVRHSSATVRKIFIAHLHCQRLFISIADNFSAPRGRQREIELAEMSDENRVARKVPKARTAR